eukprot:gnl/TRDRNA2_/TRDRNA2_152519_c1_seq1.p1 gnl/TRDRNA2_/TRDRNA2_152519_c1~~gnl/TRDRNA2_/TRDRNA2_152519_c1_seq1.p1  ORF type:complete len:244 (+),score=62.61 gnl/TRDRNA2_/TRDRNA2_152519_c1_seq1:67-732(+)
MTEMAQQRLLHSAEQRKANHVLEAAMIHWDDCNQMMLLHALLQVWNDIISENKEEQKLAHREADDELREQLKQAQDRRMKALLLKLEAGSNEGLEHFFFDCWYQACTEARDKRLADHHEAEELRRRQKEEQLELKIEEGEDLIQRGQKSEEEGDFDTARHLYSQGISRLLKTEEQMPEHSARKNELKRRIHQHLRRAENLKLKLSRSPRPHARALPPSTSN